MRYLIILLLLAGCGGESVKAAQATQEQLSLSYSYTNNNCSWWSIPQLYNGVPKYSGSLCTYTNKHIPVAAYGGDDLFYVTTDNLTDGNFYVYAHKGEEKVLVHQINNWSDPHTNAAIQLDNNGYVMVHVASRGLSHKFQSGKILKSKTPYQLDFECVDGCGNDNFEAYPQVFDTSFGYYVGYTHYVKDAEIHPSRNIRELWYRIGSKRTRLAKGAHYSLTNYHNGFIYVVFNYLKNGGADDRYNLYGLKTRDGVNWLSFDNKPLTLPLEQDDPRALIYNSGENRIYLKDLTFVAGPRVLFTESTSVDPTQGERWLKEWYQDDEQPVLTVTKTNHNYSSGAYVKYKTNTFIFTNPDSESDYLGGTVDVYQVFMQAHKKVATLDAGNMSYIRKVYNGDGLAVAGFGEGDTPSGSQHITLSLRE